LTRRAAAGDEREPRRRRGRRERQQRVGYAADVVASWVAASSAPTKRSHGAKVKQADTNSNAKEEAGAGAIKFNGIDSAQIAPGVQAVAVFYPAVADVRAVVHVGDQDIFNSRVHLCLRLLHGLAQADDHEDYS
jgi:hypothetical protein